MLQFTVHSLTSSRALHPELCTHCRTVCPLAAQLPLIHSGFFLEVCEALWLIVGRIHPPLPFAEKTILFHNEKQKLNLFLSYLRVVGFSKIPGTKILKKGVCRLQSRKGSVQISGSHIAPPLSLFVFVRLMSRIAFLIANCFVLLRCFSLFPFLLVYCYCHGGN